MKTESYEERNRGIISKEEQKEEQEELRRGPWTLEEDTLLIHYVACHGEGRWNLLAKSAGLKRTGKSCRLRWLNYLKPDIKRGNLTPQEQLLILELHSKLGNRWSKIAAHLPGRTDNEIKNYWRTRVQKQARQLNMESNSPSFIDAIRCFYMPRLVQKIEQTTTTTTAAAATNSEIEASSSNSADTSPSQMVTSPNNFNNKMGHIVNLDSTTKHTSCTTVSPSNVSEFPDLPSSQNSKGSSLTLDDCYYVNGSYYDMDLPAMSASDIPGFDCHVAGHNWPGDDDMAQDAGVWDLDQLW